MTAAEAASNTTTQERGLAFVAYQAQLSMGFHFLQQTWADNTNFPPGKTPSSPGLDPIIGQNNGQLRIAAGLDPSQPTGTLSIPQFVVSHGGGSSWYHTQVPSLTCNTGEYFFSPPISAIRGRLAA